MRECKRMWVRMRGAFTRFQGRVCAWVKPQVEAEHGDVPGWVLITLMTAALVVVIWGVASDRLVEIFNRAMDSLSAI